MSKAVAGPHPVIDGDRYVPALLSHINNALSSTASQLYLREFGIGLNEWRILSVLSNRPHSSATHICDTVFIHKAVASRSLREMQAKALLTIEKHDGQRVMALTPEGQRMHDEIAHIALEREQRLLGALSPGEREQLIDFMRRMRAQLAELGAWDPPRDFRG